jgi:hypothetical protein
MAVQILHFPMCGRPFIGTVHGFNPAKYLLARRAACLTGKQKIMEISFLPVLFARGTDSSRN